MLFWTRWLGRGSSGRGGGGGQCSTRPGEGQCSFGQGVRGDNEVLDRVEEDRLQF
jgi:hypothetical protein